MPALPPRSVLGLGAATAALFLAGVVGVGTVGVDERRQIVTIDGRSLPSVPPAPEGPAAEPVDLVARFVPSPAGFEQIPDAQLPAAGAVTLDQLAAERSDGERARQVFTATRMLDGAVRAWQRGGGQELLTVRMYQFADAAGAASYEEQALNAMRVAPATTFKVDGAERAVGIDTGRAQGTARVVYVIARKGRVVIAIAAALAQPPDLAVLTGTTRAQLEQLP